jgi:hypothetical protein
MTLGGLARASRENLPHKKYGVDTSNIPDYLEPFVGYRAWQWDEEGITSLNNVRWAPKVAFVATCPRVEEHVQLLEEVRGNPAYPGIPVRLLAKLRDDAEIGLYYTAEDIRAAHPVPNEQCTCGLYSGINMEHLQHDTDYIHRGIHGEVSLWGRVYPHSLGWRAQYGYPKFFVVPPDMLPFTMKEIQKKMESLIAYDVDIYLQVDKVPSRDGAKIPFWIKDYGYSQQGIDFLCTKRAQWYADSPKIRNLAEGDRVVVLGETGGIGIVKLIEGEEFWYNLFNPNVFYRKRIKDVKWSDRNWRWETTGVGVVTVIGR